MTIKSIGHKILYFPLTRIIIGFSLLCLTIYLSTIFLDKILENSFYINDPQNPIYSITIAALVVLAYYFLFRFYEKRKITELSVHNLGRNLLLGVSIGLIFQSLVIFIMYLGGSYKVLSVNNISSIIPGLSIGIVSGTCEEILFRGVIFRITEEKLGSIIALVISSILFGAIHLNNPNSTIFTAACISLEASLAIGAAYIYTRSLWFPIALHFGWNFAESGIYGAPNSGILIDQSLLTSKIEGNTLLTGGDFGPEGSLPCLVFGFTLALILLYLINKENKLIKPFWVKNISIPII